jgi:hypothetical protein
VVAIAGLVFGQDAARGAISEELGRLLGPTGGDFIKSVLERSSDPGSGIIATVLGVVTILITASGVFGEMHTALNKTFKAKPSDEPISALLRTRAASLGLVAALGFMLVVSLASGHPDTVARSDARRVRHGRALHHRKVADRNLSRSRGAQFALWRRRRADRSDVLDLLFGGDISFRRRAHQGRRR